MVFRGLYKSTSLSVDVHILPVAIPGPYQVSLSVNGQQFFPDTNDVSATAPTTFEFFPTFVVFGPAVRGRAAGGDSATNRTKVIVYADNLPGNLLFTDWVCCHFTPFMSDFANVSVVCVGGASGSATYVPATQGGPYVVCEPPPLPVTVDPYSVWVALDGQNYGDDLVSSSGGGVQYTSIGCAGGEFAATVAQFCLPCAPGTVDSRNAVRLDFDFDRVENKVRWRCAAGDIVVTMVIDPGSIQRVLLLVTER